MVVPGFLPDLALSATEGQLPCIPETTAIGNRGRGSIVPLNHLIPRLTTLVAATGLLPLTPPRKKAEIDQASAGIIPKNADKLWGVRIPWRISPSSRRREGYNQDWGPQRVILGQSRLAPRVDQSQAQVIVAKSLANDAGVELRWRSQQRPVGSGPVALIVTVRAGYSCQ